MTDGESFHELCRFRPPAAGRLVLWELTNHCNLACAHCCTLSSPQVSRQNDVGLDQALAAIRDFGPSHVTEVTFTGGEAMVRRDFTVIVEEACKQAVDVFIATNGTLLNDDKISRLAGLRIKRLTISLDGHTAASHNELRRHPQAFARAVRGIKLCVASGVPIRVSHMITPQNRDMLEDFCRFVADLEVPRLVLHSIVPAGRAAVERQTVMDRSTETSVTETIARIQSELEGQLLIDHSLERANSLAPAGCPAGSRVAHISANGDVSVCSWLYKLDRSRFTLGNIKSERLVDVLGNWRDAMAGVPDLETTCIIPWVIQDQKRPRRTAADQTAAEKSIDRRSRG